MRASFDIVQNVVASGSWLNNKLVQIPLFNDWFERDTLPSADFTPKTTCDRIGEQTKLKWDNRKSSLMEELILYPTVDDELSSETFWEKAIIAAGIYLYNIDSASIWRTVFDSELIVVGAWWSQTRSPTVPALPWTEIPSFNMLPCEENDNKLWRVCQDRGAKYVLITNNNTSMLVVDIFCRQCPK